jgi:hypothetical protein
MGGYFDLGAGVDNASVFRIEARVLNEKVLSMA